MNTDRIVQGLRQIAAGFESLANELETQPTVPLVEQMKDRDGARPTVAVNRIPAHGKALRDKPKKKKATGTPSTTPRAKKTLRPTAPILLPGEKLDLRKPLAPPVMPIHTPDASVLQAPRQRVEEEARELTSEAMKLKQFVPEAARDMPTFYQALLSQAMLNHITSNTELIRKVAELVFNQ